MRQILLILLYVPLISFGQNGPFYFMDNNIQREFYLHIPSNLPPNSPIVYVLHGWGGSGASIMSNTAFNILSDQNIPQLDHLKSSQHILHTVQITIRHLCRYLSVH